jgi:hypothetical protein
MEDSVDYLLGELGLERHMTWIVEHIDTDCMHVHALVCGVHPGTRKMWNSSFYKARLFDASRELEREYGWAPATTKTLAEIWREEQPSLTYFEREYEALGREMPYSVKVRILFSPAFKHAESWAQLVHEIDEFDLFLVPRRDAGMVLTTGADYVSLSKISPAFSRPKLEARFRMTWGEYCALVEAGYAAVDIHDISLDRQSQVESGDVSDARDEHGQNQSGESPTAPENDHELESSSTEVFSTEPSRNEPSGNEPSGNEPSGNEPSGSEAQSREAREEQAVPRQDDLEDLRDVEGSHDVDGSRDAEGASKNEAAEVNEPAEVNGQERMAQEAARRDADPGKEPNDEPFEPYRSAYEAALRQRDSLPIDPPSSQPYSDDLKTPLLWLQDVQGRGRPRPAVGSSSDIDEPPPLSDLALEWDTLRPMADDARQEYEALHERWESALAEGAAAPREVIENYRRAAAMHGSAEARLAVLSSADESSHEDDSAHVGDRHEGMDGRPTDRHPMEPGPFENWMAEGWTGRPDLQALHEEMTDAESRIGGIAVYRTELTQRVAEHLQVEPWVVEEAWTESSQPRLYAPAPHVPEPHSAESHSAEPQNRGTAAQKQIQDAQERALVAMDAARSLDSTSKRARNLATLVRKQVHRDVNACTAVRVAAAAYRPMEVQRERAAVKELSAMINLDDCPTYQQQREECRRAVEMRMDELFEDGNRAEEALIEVASENGVHASICALADHPSRFGVLREDQALYSEVCLDSMQDAGTTLDAFCKYREGGLARAMVRAKVAEAFHLETKLEALKPRAREMVAQDISTLRRDWDSLREEIHFMPDDKTLSSRSTRLYERANQESREYLQEMVESAREHISAGEEAERVLHDHSRLEACFSRLYEHPVEAQARFEQAAFPNGVDHKADAFAQAVDELKRTPSHFGAWHEGLTKEQVIRRVDRVADVAANYARAVEDLRRRVLGRDDGSRRPRLRPVEALEAAKKQVLPKRLEAAHSVNKLYQDVRRLRDRGITRW